LIGLRILVNCVCTDLVACDVNDLSVTVLAIVVTDQVYILEASVHHNGTKVKPIAMANEGDFSKVIAL
jgi:hypothetical protein